MTALLVPVLAVLAAPAPMIEARLVRVAPPEATAGRPEPPRKARAVVLIHGLVLHPLSKDAPARAQLRPWQLPGSLLVRRLADGADVFAFAYAQTVPVEDVAAATDLAGRLRGLRKLGYREIVLVGHSAGGLIARHAVEDHPDLPVTRVVQVCAPNTGSSWALVKASRPAQAPFLRSLTKAARANVLRARADKRLPAAVQFAAVVGIGRLGGDGFVSAHSQWPDDLQKQGVAVYPLRVAHRDAVKIAAAVILIARLVEQPQPRWDGRQVAQARPLVFGKAARPGQAPEVKR
jgi:pimeloyl-ACP methyl ester carboxylesterase